MPADFSLDIRLSIVAHLRGDSTVTDLVPEERIYGEQPKDAVPAWPFIRFGMPIAAPWEATCYDGSQNRTTIHGFAKGPGTDAIARIMAVVVASMDRWEPATFENLGDGWLGTNILVEEGEPNKLHGIAEFDVIAARRSAP